MIRTAETSRLTRRGLSKACGGLLSAGAGLAGGKTALGVCDERITGALFFDGEECSVGFGGAGAVQAFARATLIVVDGGQDVIAGDVVEKYRGGFAAAL